MVCVGIEDKDHKEANLIKENHPSEKNTTITPRFVLNLSRGHLTLAGEPKKQSANECY